MGRKAKPTSNHQKLRAENDGEFLFRRWAHEVEGGPLFFQGALKKELDAADGDGHGVAGVMLDVLEVKEVLPQFFLADQVGRLVIVFRQLAHCPDVTLLSAFGQASKLETLDHSLTQFGHGYTSSD